MNAKNLLALAWLLMLFTVAPCQAAERPLRVLMLSGQNNHDWRATTPVIQTILSNAGPFHVEVTEHPEHCDRKQLDRYDVLISNWNNWGDVAVKEWPEKTREAFLGFVRDGRGLVIVHAGSSSFLDWKEYQQLVGGTWGAETGHGKRHEFEVKLVKDHPITRGLQAFKTTDELWHRTAVQPDIQVLATAYSSKENGGSGRDEPVAFVTAFGKGRCFNLVLGHDIDAMKADGFKALLARGTAWAAAGKVNGK